MQLIRIAFLFLGLSAGWILPALPVFSVFSTPAFAGAPAKPVLRVAVSGPYPPFAEVNEAGELYGFDVDIAWALCRQLKRECQVENMDFDALIPALSAGELDMAVAGMGATEERRRLVDFTERYYRSVSTFIEVRGRLKDVTHNTIRGLRVGAQQGSLQAEYLASTYGNLITLIPDPSYKELFAMLKAGEVDLVFSDGLPGYAYLTSPEGQGLETVGAPVEPGGVMDRACVAVSKKQPELRQALNRAIQDLRRSGEYDRINRKYFDFIIY